MIVLEKQYFHFTPSFVKVVVRLEKIVGVQTICQ
jgi:hypothetical protein